MDETNETPSDLTAEIRRLGDNLKEVFRTAWESEERKKIQDEIETGLSELGTILKDATDEFTQGSTGQSLKAEVEDFQDRVRSGEVQSKMRTDFLTALQLINRELEKAASQVTGQPSGAEGETPRPETHPDESPEV